jgi:L-ascorbate metabolism protein UlaG (beta-lactamase superfamily)
MNLRRLTLATALGTLSISDLACGTAGRLPGAVVDWSSPRVDADVFMNPWRDPADDGERAGPAYILRKAGRQIAGHESIDGRPEVVALDLAAMAREPFAVAWLGHASLLIHARGRWILVDPVLRSTIGPLPGLGPRRFTPPALSVEDLPPIDVVLLSHDHFDHLDLPTLRAIAKRAETPAKLLGGQGLERVLDASLRRHFEALDWWGQGDVAGLTITFTPAQHGSGRSITRKNRTLWGGWHVAGPDGRFYFAGDTADALGLFEVIRTRLGAPDVAAIPVGAYAPRPWMRFEHLDPAEAHSAFERVGAVSGFGVHWGTFALGEESPQETREAFKAAARASGDARFRLMAIGDWMPVNATEATTP